MWSRDMVLVSRPSQGSKCHRTVIKCKSVEVQRGKNRELYNAEDGNVKVSVNALVWGLGIGV